jgi:putative FmdB family regulatory protein
MRSGLFAICFMPIYEYGCLICGAHIEKRQSISDEPLKICEKCGGELEKKISLSGFQFKGGGWYVTDYASKAGKSADKATGGSEKSSGTESTAGTNDASKSKSDAAPAAKTDKPAAKDKE